LTFFRRDGTSCIYSFIPKNACTTMRYSLALSSGCIRGRQDFDWIHNNNWTFSASFRDLVSAESSFVILRCPFSRLASFFLDKVVDCRPPAHALLPFVDEAGRLEDVTFRKLAAAIRRPKA